ncbi:MAG: CHAT domain-containing tetratricopeptide repeat protein [Chloroflexota bacterium]
MNPVLDCPDRIADLLADPDPALSLQKQMTRWQEDPACTEQLATSLKSRSDHLLRTDLTRARRMAQLLFDLADITDQPAIRALGLRAQGNILMIGEYRCQEAIACYDEATAIYQAVGQTAAAAQSQVGKVGCLYFLGSYNEAIAVGETVRSLLADHGEWGALTGLLLNLAAIHRRLGQGQAALALLAEAESISTDTGADSQLPGLLLNQANVLCDLGQLPAALATAQRAESLFQERRQRVGAARAQMSQAIACFHLGRYNEAMDLFDQAQGTYEADGRFTDALLVDRFAADLLLQLGRYAEVIARCQQVRDRYSDHAIPYEVAQALRTEAAAYAALGRPQAALASLAEARTLLADNVVRVALIDLETAVLLTQQQEPQKGLDLALACSQTFRAHEMQLPAARAVLAAAQAAWQVGQTEQAASLCQQITELGVDASPWLNFQTDHLLGKMAQANDRLPQAITAYKQAVAHLERLRGRLMVELRSDFLSDKGQVYEDLVTAYLAADQAQAALATVTQAKSRALMDLLAHRLDLRLMPQQVEDKPLIERLDHLRQRRNQLLRRAETSQDETERAEDHTLILKLEKEITAVWQKLLIRHADYARDLDLLRGQSLPGAPRLDADTLLLEFFIAQGDLLIFMVSQEGVQVERLPQALAQLSRPSRLLNVNLKAMAHQTLGQQELGQQGWGQQGWGQQGWGQQGWGQHRQEQAAALLAGTQAQLAQLYQLLLQPIAPTLARYSRLLLVPHGALLHYLPFAALYDGHEYLAQRHQLISLPNAALRHFPPPSVEPTGRPAVFGYSGNGRLPQAPQEAAAVAQLLGGDTYLEEAATLDQLQASATHSPILHLATHGDFNPDNPLFSGLRLFDGQLTTLDIFNLRLPASLVTLSACQTGRSVVGGGDELLGLMRAFLYAGASSLLLSRWPIHDAATRFFMVHFYRQLQAGHSQSEALRLTQHHFLSGQAGDAYCHPYYWATFFLVTIQE